MFASLCDSSSSSDEGGGGGGGGGGPNPGGAARKQSSSARKKSKKIKKKEATLSAAAKRRARKKRADEARRRSEYDQRMIRRAQREGKPDDFYLRVGREPPTQEQVREARALPPEQRMGWWRVHRIQYLMSSLLGVRRSSR